MLVIDHPYQRLSSEEWERIEDWEKRIPDVLNEYYAKLEQRLLDAVIDRLYQRGRIMAGEVILSEQDPVYNRYRIDYTFPESRLR